MPNSRRLSPHHTFSIDGWTMPPFMLYCTATKPFVTLMTGLIYSYISRYTPHIPICLKRRLVLVLRRRGMRCRCWRSWWRWILPGGSAQRTPCSTPTSGASPSPRHLPSCPGRPCGHTTPSTCPLRSAPYIPCRLRHPAGAHKRLP